MSPLPDETGGQEEKRVEEARQTRSSSCPRPAAGKCVSLVSRVCICAFV